MGDELSILKWNYQILGFDGFVLFVILGNQSMALHMLASTFPQS